MALLHMVNCLGDDFTQNENISILILSCRRVERLQISNQFPKVMHIVNG